MRRCETPVSSQPCIFRKVFIPPTFTIKLGRSKGIEPLYCGPQPHALTTELTTPCTGRLFYVVYPSPQNMAVQIGFEPMSTLSESVVLPLHYWTIVLKLESNDSRLLDTHNRRLWKFLLAQSNGNHTIILNRINLLNIN